MEYARSIILRLGPYIMWAMGGWLFVWGIVLSTSVYARPFPFVCTLPLIQVEVSNTNSANVTQKDYFLRKSELNGLPYSEMLRITEYDSDTPFKTVVISREVFLDQMKPDGELFNKIPEDPSGSFQHMRMVREILAKNLGAYRERRPHWTGDFRKDLAHIASEYLNDAKYIAVVDKRTNQVVGGERFIFAPYAMKDGKMVAEGNLVERYYGPIKGFRERGEALGPYPDQFPRPPSQLPEEIELGITLDHPTVRGYYGSQIGMNIEMGTLFVDNGLPVTEKKQVWGELWLHAMKIAHDHGAYDSHYGVTIHAFADKQSLKLYLPLGFELNRSYVKDGVRHEYGPEEKVPPVKMKDGSEWWPIVYHPEQIDRFVLDWKSGKHPMRDSDFVRKRLDELAGLGYSGSNVPAVVEREKASLLMDAFLQGKDASRVYQFLQEFRAHAQRVKETVPGTPDRERAERALAQVVPAIETIKQRLPDGLKGDIAHREKLTMVAGAAARGSEGRAVFGSREVVDTLFAPLLMDQDFTVQIAAIYRLRENFTDAVGLGQAMGGDPQSSRAFLLAQGISPDQIRVTSEAFRTLMNSPKFWLEFYKTEVYPADREIDQRIVDGLYAAVGPLRGKDPKIIAHLLILAGQKD